MKKSIKFVDGRNNLVKVEFRTERDYCAFTGDYNTSSGQIYDDFEPRTDLQQELVDAWMEHHLKANEQTVVDKIADLMDKVQQEYNEWYASLLDEKLPDINDEEASLSYLIDECSRYYEDDARMIYAALKANNYDLRVVKHNFVEIDTPPYYRYGIVTIFGVEYYVCDGYDLDESANNYLADNTELWKEAVAHDRTYMGLTEWAEDVVNTDGGLSVMGWSEVDTIEVEGTDYIVAVQD